VLSCPSTLQCKPSTSVAATECGDRSLVRSLSLHGLPSSEAAVILLGAGCLYRLQSSNHKERFDTLLGVKDERGHLE